MPNIQGFSTLRARSYVLRLPLFTRGLVVVITAFYFAGLLPLWDLRQWGALIPDQMNIFTCQYHSPALPVPSLLIWVFSGNRKSRDNSQCLAQGEKRWK